MVTKNKRVAYFGDGNLNGPASYLSGILAKAGIKFDHFPSDTPANLNLTDKEYGLYILSDYPSQNFDDRQLNHIEERIRLGDSLLMIGGWESYYGLNGEYNNSILADILPVKMQEKDDRLNSYKPLIVEPVKKHEITSELDWSEPPVVGGLNIVSPKKDSEVILQAQKLDIKKYNERYDFILKETYPLLVIGTYGRGKTASFLSDVAPHWIGGMVDWGETRVSARGPNSAPVEVGDQYILFFTNIIRWCLK